MSMTVSTNIFRLCSAALLGRGFIVSEIPPPDIELHQQNQCDEKTGYFTIVIFLVLSLVS